ncbi:magnesium/cobalt transporter CorA [Mesorhizobium denitrificans]|nr:magnesium/cobalt transporter CorA [Mesorhizobium denitrificans]
MPDSVPSRDAGRMRAKKHSPIGASPGTLIADPTAQKPILTLTVISPAGSKTFSNASVDDVRRERGHWPLVWLDCSGLADVGLVQEIGQLFGLHPLSLEDTVNTGQRPKADFFDTNVFVVLTMIDDHITNRPEQISVFFGSDFVVTFQEREGDPFDPVRKRLEAATASRLRAKKADYLAYALIDAIVDSYFPCIEQLNGQIDAIEDEILTGLGKDQVGRLHLLRRRAGQLKRALWPTRDAIAALLRSDSVVITPETKIYLNDTYDHAISQLEAVESARDMLTGLIEMHLSLSQARTNDVISFLTIVSAVFIPLTFLAGIWGMNFDPDKSPFNMPELESYYGYPAALGFMALVALLTICFFKWKKWI